MKRHLWTQNLTEYYCPAWPCPVCSKGTIQLVRKSLVHSEIVESESEHDNPGWDPSWVSYVFSAWGKCGHNQCSQEFVISGIGGVQHEYLPEEETEWAKYFSPKFCWPMPDIFEIPKKCPDEIKTELRNSFELFWVSPSASANRLRIALELLMDSLKVQKRRKNKHGKFSKLSLHQRIEYFQNRDQEIGKQLMALKWVGNTGSHEHEVVSKDLLDAYEILEHALAELIDRKTYKIKNLAKKLTKKHKRRN